MSFHHPQDRHVHQKEKIEKEYKDAREHLSHTESQIQAEEEAFGAAHRDESSEDRLARFEADAERRLDQAGKEIRQAYDKKRGG
jgi:predicted  nucleic acid-binding Zn-ribbon protein